MVIDNKALYMLGIALMGLLIITIMLVLNDNSCKTLKTYMNESQCFKQEVNGMIQSCVIWTDR